MPIKILFIENDKTTQDSLKSLLQNISEFQYAFLDNFSLLNEKLLNNYTHLVSTLEINTINDEISIPVLIVSKENLETKSFSSTKPPLTYPKLFAFLCEQSIISDNTLEKYAMGDPDFMNQMKGHIVEEFEQNIAEMPQLINSKNIEEIKSKVHQLVSKFSLLEMVPTYELSKEIDANILEQPEKQISNTKQLLLDIEIALSQLK
jgi:HPt (histidine-containing phosphotransfer) domain-containing protein